MDEIKRADLETFCINLGIVLTADISLEELRKIVAAHSPKEEAQLEQPKQDDDQLPYESIMQMTKAQLLEYLATRGVDANNDLHIATLRKMARGEE